MTATRRAFLGSVAAIVVAPSLAPARGIAFTAGGFADFGQGTLVMLHGGETIIPLEVDRLVAALQEIR